MTLQPQTPRYQQLAQLLRERIESGALAPGEALPGAAALARDHGVSQATAQNAVTLLRREGLVTSRQGAGTFVRQMPVIHRRASQRHAAANREAGANRGAFDYEIRQLGMVPRSDVTVSRVVPPADVAEVLALAEGEQCLVRERKMYANDTPLQFAPSYIPLDIAEAAGLEQTDTGSGGTISRMAEAGYAQVRITESIRARRATADESSFLALETDQPVFEIFRIGWTAEDRAAEVGVWILSASGWILDYGWPLD